MSTESGVYAALVQAQGKFPAITKSHTATVSSEKDGKWTKYSYQYADLSDIMTAIRPVLAECGLAVSQPIEILEGGGLALRTCLFHGDGSSIHSLLPLSPPGPKPQAFGSSLTYMRRYALTSLLGIASEEDDDASAAEQPGPVDRQHRPQRQPPRSNGASHRQDVERAITAQAPIDLDDYAILSSDPLHIDGLSAKEAIATLEYALEQATPAEADRLLATYRPKLETASPKAFGFLAKMVAQKIEARP